VFVTTDAGKTVYVIDSIDPKDRATFTIKVPDGTKATLPASGIIDFEYDFFKESIINNFDTNNTDLPIFEILTEQFYYHNIDLTQVIDPKCNPKLTYIDRFKPYIVRRRHMSFAIHKQGLADSGSGSTLMNGMAFDEFNRTVAYLGTNEEILIENLSDVIHLFHIHINYFQVMGYRDSGFRENVVDHPVISDSGQYAYRTEIPVPFEGFEDTVTIPVGRVKAGDLDAVEGARGQVRVRISHEDYTGIFLMHCHLLDDQDMGMMQQVEVVTFGYEQPNVADDHHSHG
jgi:FtsP/CotA-like multicopper oxidase with cupredoxin domain